MCIQRDSIPSAIGVKGFYGPASGTAYQQILGERLTIAWTELVRPV